MEEPDPKCRLPRFVTILAAINDECHTINGKILLAGSWGVGLRRTGGSPPPTMRAILNIGLQHHFFTSLSPIGEGSEKAFAPDFDCAWGEKMRIGPERVG